MRIKILGSNGWYASATGNTSCVLIETKDFYLVLDAGDGLANTKEPPTPFCFWYNLWVFIKFGKIKKEKGRQVLNKILKF